MAYPIQHVKVTISGTVANEDIWSNSFTLVPQDGSGAADMFADLEPSALATPARNFYAATGNGMATYNRMTSIKLALIGVDGKTVGEPKYYDYPTPVVGTYSGSVIPQASIVVSLLTDVPRGLANRGRFYLPSGFGDVDNSSGRLTTVVTTAIAGRAVTWINALNTFAQTASPAGGVAILSAVGAGAEHRVSAVAVGNLVDTQRRRRNRLTEVYVETPLVTP